MSMAVVWVAVRVVSMAVQLAVMMADQLAVMMAYRWVLRFN